MMKYIHMSTRMPVFTVQCCIVFICIASLLSSATAMLAQNNTAHVAFVGMAFNLLLYAAYCWTQLREMLLDIAACVTRDFEP